MLRERVAVLEADRGAGASRHRVRAFFAALLIVVGCVLAPLAVLASWTSSEVGDTDRYVATVAPLASDADVQDAVADRVTDAVMSRLDLNALLSGVAPDQRPALEKALGKLGDALQNAVRGFVHDKARAVAGSDAFATVWTRANRRAHSAVDKALTGSGGGAVQLTDDAVTIDLGPVVDQVKQRLVADGLTVAGRIPEVHTELVVARSEDIGKIRPAFRVLQVLGNWLPVVAVLFLAVGVLLARGRRRATVAAALGAAFATLLLGAGLVVFRALYLDALPPGVSRGAAGSVYDALTRFLRVAVRTVVAVGVVVALAAWVTGGGRWARRVRGAWGDGIGAVRGAADRFGFRTGPVGPWLGRYGVRVGWALVAAAVLTLVLWSYPTGWVVFGLALALVFALALVTFLAGG
ncbi:hypothetical protein OG268_19655 [Streptomyces uncialis]|nr:hypothetical protein OG268_19655 [Streptomyces uncialis]